MAKVTYTGGSEGDSRVLAAADLAKAGVEGFVKTTFAHGEIKEVDDEVAQALTNDSELFGSFIIAANEDPTLFDVPEVKAKSAAK